ncbi:E3 ubiquitin-protein ligase TRIM65-like isoform X2 [Vanacampus margaritifer]
MTPMSSSSGVVHIPAPVQATATMAQAEISLDGAQFNCSICLEVLRDPVTVPCGHSFCSVCLTGYWDSQLVCSCPHCRATFSPRPTLGKNTLLTELIQRLAVAARRSPEPSAPSFKQDPEPGGNRSFQHVTFDVSSVCPQRTVGEKHLAETQKYLAQQITEKESELQQLEHASRSFSSLAKAAAKDSNRIFSELQEFFRRRQVEVKELIRTQEKVEVTRAENRLHRLQRQISELKRRDAALQKLSQSQDPQMIVQTCKSFCSPVQVGENTSLTVSPHVSFGGVRKAVSDMKEHLLGFYSTEFENITTAVKNVNVLQVATSTKVLEKCRTSNIAALENRSALLQYFCPLSLDPFTAHRELVLTRGNRKVSRTGEVQSYADHPDRFDAWVQVMCHEGLQGIHYWEMEWDGQQVAVGLTYESIKRKGSSNENRLGHNSGSWSLCCSDSSYAFTHANQTTGISCSGVCRRIGIFLNHDQGLLCFYALPSDGIRLLQQVKTDFQQPLYPAMWLGAEATVSLCCVD